MAEAEIARVVDEAERRWPFDAVAIIHRYGVFAPAKPSSSSRPASAHRTEAFHAAEFLMDYLKTRAPFWKKAHRSSGSGDWVAAKDDDEAAAARW
ncbi:MAG: molybdenum cofactor biosynthesis protein MoaE [Methylovirgula sp.]